MEKNIDFIKGLIIVVLASALATATIWFFTSNITPKRKPTGNDNGGLHVHILDKNSEVVQNLNYPITSAMDLCINESCYLSEARLGRYATDGFEKSDFNFDELMAIAYYNNIKSTGELTVTREERKDMFRKFWGAETIYQEKAIDGVFCIGDEYSEVDQMYHATVGCGPGVSGGNNISYYTSIMHQVIENQNHLSVDFYMLYYRASRTSQGKMKYEFYSDMNLTNKLSEVERVVESSNYVLEQDALEEYVNEHLSELEKYVLYFEKQNDGKYYFLQAKKVYTVDSK